MIGVGGSGDGRTNGGEWQGGAAWRYRDGHHVSRTYVHHGTGFDLLASETPQRLTMPATQWLPARYLAAFARPVPEQRVQGTADGTTQYRKLRKVDARLAADNAAARNLAMSAHT